MTRIVVALLLLALIAVAVWRDRHRHDLDDFILYGIYNRAFSKPKPRLSNADIDTQEPWWVG